MGDGVQETIELLRRPLYLFDLPTELLLSLRRRDVAHLSPEMQEPLPKPSEDTSAVQIDSISTSISCASCQASFEGVVEQRDHVKSDFHRYNLKLRLRGLPSVDESAFNTLIGGLDESLSGSESSGWGSEHDEKENPQDSTLAALLKHQAKISERHQGEETHFKRRKGGSGTSPLLWLSSSKLPEGTSLGIYKVLFTEAEQDKDVVEIVKQKQLKPVQTKHGGSGIEGGTQTAETAVTKSPHYFLCMIGGGHFAAMVVSLVPEHRKGPGGRLERHAIVRAHKTFHRYTTRRKQGGSQSTNDNAKGNAHSAGASIRRYNEMALQADVRGVLSEWRPMIDKSELLFIRATGTTSRRTLYGPYEGQVLRANDTRTRGFPFSTRRATQSELMRSFTELTTLKVSTISESALIEAAAKQEEVCAPARPRIPSGEPNPKLGKEEEGAVMHTTQIQALIRRKKAPALLTYLTNNSLSPDFFFFPPNAPHHHHAPTPLHLAASNNASSLVLALLTKTRADPTLPNGDGKTAFDIAGDTKTRDAFRVARHFLGEAAVDWKAAHVPFALSAEEAEDRQQKEDLKETTTEAERRKVELEKLRQEERIQKTDKIERRAGTTGQRLGNREETDAEVREKEGRGLTPQMRAQLEREKRARAAEARLRK